ncbi:hypothetical protein ACIP02_08805 [Pseudomonas sp. NPDC089408]
MTESCLVGWARYKNAEHLMDWQQSRILHGSESAGLSKALILMGVIF